MSRIPRIRPGLVLAFAAAVLLGAIFGTATSFGFNPVAMVQSLTGIDPPASTRTEIPRHKSKTATETVMTTTPVPATTAEASTPAPAQKPQPAAAPATPAAPVPVSTFELAVQEDSGLIFRNDPQIAIATTALADGLPAKWVRMILYSDKVYGAKKPQYIGFGAYRKAIAQQVAKGRSVQLTISCNKREWTIESFTAFVAEIMSNFSSLVSRYSICNEPNLGSWLVPLPGLSEPDTYCKLYRAGYGEVKRVLPAELSQVFIGEFSSSNNPEIPNDSAEEFMREVLRPDGECAQLVSDGFAFHPYRWIDSLPQLNAYLDEVGASGALRTPHGSRLEIYLTEYGYQSQDRGDRAAIPNRAQLWQEDLKKLCYDIPHIAQIMNYQLIQSPPDWPGVWDTSIGGLIPQPDGSFTPVPDPTYVAIKDWLATNPKCLKQ